jgi:hypothetical protein
MKVRTGFAFLFACLVAGYAAQAADASLDLIPAPGAAPIRLRFSQTSPGSENQPAPADIVLRRTGPTTAVVEQNSDVSPLVLGPDGSLHADPAATAARRGDLGDLLSAINIAHGVTGGAGAGNRAGWTAQIPAPDRPRPDGAPIPTETPSPSPPLVLPVRALALNSNGDLDIDGTVETSLSAPESSSTAHRWQHSPGGGGFGGGFGGRGGFGGSRDAATPVSLDVRVTGHIARNALTRMTISQTRRVVLDGLTYSNVGIWTIDVIR